MVTFFVLPNALGTFKSAFFPHGGIVAEQDNIQPGNELYGNGRLADIGPTLDQWRERPIFRRGWARGSSGWCRGRTPRSWTTSGSTSSSISEPLGFAAFVGSSSAAFGGWARCAR